MEQDIAILMADLSGYTALTETHGPHGAADMVEKYSGIVQGCLVGDSHLHSPLHQKENTALKISAKKKKCLS